MAAAGLALVMSPSEAQGLPPLDRLSDVRHVTIRRMQAGPSPESAHSYTATQPGCHLFASTTPSDAYLPFG